MLYAEMEKYQMNLSYKMVKFTLHFEIKENKMGEIQHQQNTRQMYIVTFVVVFYNIKNKIGILHKIS